MAIVQPSSDVDYSQQLNIVLVEPEIPGNTGTIGRLCVGLEASLTLVEPLGFSLEDKYLRRAGLDYWPWLKWCRRPSFQALLDEIGDPDRFHLLTTKSQRPYTHATFRTGDFLVFGKETRGLPESLLEQHAARTLTIPMWGETRSINLAISVGIVAYEAMRQIKDGF